MIKVKVDFKKVRKYFLHHSDIIIICVLYAFVYSFLDIKMNRLTSDIDMLENKLREVHAEEPKEEPPTVEEYMCDKFGDSCNMAMAIAKAESGMNCEAVNGNTNTTVDLGLFMINEVHYDENFTPSNALDCFKNIDKAHEIWEEQGWYPWVAYLNKSYLTFYNR